MAFCPLCRDCGRGHHRGCARGDRDCVRGGRDCVRFFLYGCGHHHNV